MELDTITTVLVAIVPSLSAVIAIVSGLVSIVRQFKKLSKEQKNETILELTKHEDKLKKAYDDLAILKTKITSIEKYLVDKKKE